LTDSHLYAREQISFLITDAALRWLSVEGCCLSARTENLRQKGLRGLLLCSSLLTLCQLLLHHPITDSLVIGSGVCLLTSHHALREKLTHTATLRARASTR
jgi:hypothetical protein